jgi:predicted nicotinamide N-methyase
MPYWAFAWPGGQALARYVLDHPQVVRGKRVLDFGCGCAVEGLAAAKAGAASVLCADLDLHAGVAVSRNAAENRLTVGFTARELLGDALEGVDTVLAGDACYDEALAARLVPWLWSLARRGVEVLLGDPGRVPGALRGTEVLATYQCSFDGDPRGLTLWPTAVLRLPAVLPARGAP